MHAGAGRQFDDIAVRVAEIDRPDKTMINRSAHLVPFVFGFLQHVVKDIGFAAEGDVKIERVLSLEVEWPIRDFEKSQTGTVIHFEKSMQRTALADLERADTPKPEKILVKAPGLLRIAAAIGVVVQAFNHKLLPAMRI